MLSQLNRKNESWYEVDFLDLVKLIKRISTHECGQAHLDESKILMYNQDWIELWWYLFAYG